MANRSGIEGLGKTRGEAGAEGDALGFRYVGDTLSKPACNWGVIVRGCNIEDFLSRGLPCFCMAAPGMACDSAILLPPTKMVKE